VVFVSLVQRVAQLVWCQIAAHPGGCVGLEAVAVGASGVDGVEILLEDHAADDEWYI
jgi:hypothetical protein